MTITHRIVTSSGEYNGAPVNAIEGGEVITFDCLVHERGSFLDSICRITFHGTFHVITLARPVDVETRESEVE